MLRYEWVWYKSRCTGFLNARRAPLKKTENILVFYQKLPFTIRSLNRASPTSGALTNNGTAPTMENSSVPRAARRTACAFRECAHVPHRPAHRPPHAEAGGPVRVFHQDLHPPGELVADICAGSGTTAVAALNTGRRFLCFETVPAYYAAASERIRVAGAAVEAGEKGV